MSFDFIIYAMYIIGLIAVVAWKAVASQHPTWKTYHGRSYNLVMTDVLYGYIAIGLVLLTCFIVNMVWGK